MKQTIQLTIELDVTGRLLRDPETGPNEVVDIRVDEVRLPRDTFTRKQAEAHFGDLVDFALDEIDSEAWEYEYQ
tara:strand:+ start:275 stop:496 length:222 start_codon:yes stop_codon:yes gene_type:complete